MSNRRAIIYLLLLLGLTVGLNLWLDLSGSSGGEVVRRRALVGGADTAVAVEVCPRTGPSFRLEKTDRWRLVAPFRAVADQAAVERLTDALSFDPLVDSVELSDAAKLGRGLADFGLENPRMTLRVAWPKGDESVVRFGDAVPSGEGVYASVDGTPSVYVTPTGAYASASLPLDSWRRHTVFRIKPDEVTAVDIRRAGSSVRLARSGEGWEVLEPKKAVASSTAVKRIVDTVLACEVGRFVWPVGATNESVTASVALLAGYGLDPEVCETIVFRTADRHDYSISFGNAAAADSVYALVHGGTAVATVPVAVCDSVSLDAGSLIDGRLFPQEKSAVQRISLVDGEDTYLLARGESGLWRLEAPVSAAADEAAVSALVDKLLVMHSADLDEHGVCVTLVTNAPPVLVSREALLRKEGYEQLRSKTILDIDAATVRRLVFTAAGEEKPVSVVFDPERKGWNVDAAGRAGVIDADRLAAVLASLSPLKAKAVVRLKVAPGELAQYGLETPAHTLAVDRLIEGSVRKNLLIGGKVKGTDDVYATVGSSDAVFVLDGATVRLLVSGVFTE